MEWIKLDQNSLPEGEVLAGNFKKGTYGFKEKNIGYIFVDENGVISCDGEQLLQDCTHYVDLEKFDLE